MIRYFILPKKTFLKPQAASKKLFPEIANNNFDEIGLCQRTNERLFKKEEEAHFIGFDKVNFELKRC